jgi:hypothetical protein
VGATNTLLYILTPLTISTNISVLTTLPSTTSTMNFKDGKLAGITTP